MYVYIVYEWYADADVHIWETKDVFAVYELLENAENSIKGKNTKMMGLWSTWYTIEKYKVR